MFERAAAKRPDACAVIGALESISYGQLNARANQLAARLRRAGVGRGSLVAIHLDRSIELMVAVLGVWKAGAAYVPLPVDQPAERLAFYLRDAGAAVVLAHAGRCQVPDGILVMDPAGAGAGEEASGNPGHPCDPADLAFCIYTSGSTGQPKGVLVPHSGMCALQAAQSEWFGVAHADRVLQFASFGFDAFVFDLVMAFGAGATLVLRGPHLGESLVDEMVAQGVTIATLPPSLLARTRVSRVATLRCVISAGEACQAAHIESLPLECRFVNAYGPTETSIWASGYRVGPLAGCAGNVPIGVQVADARIHILDDQLRPVPPGEAGEICIAGRGLARGYHNRPGLTADKFVPDPFGQPGSRLYRTGDTGRFLPDGHIEFHGRIDHQVKIRGFRIELGEIESALLRHSSVREAVVTVRPDRGEQQLVAYLVGAEQGAVASAELRTHLQHSLPEYMVPAAWVVMDALPLNPNGKIDRQALPPPNRDAPGAAFVAPRTATEALLAGIYADVLQLARVGVDDGFRSLGGSSIQAIDVGFRADRAFARATRIPPPLGNMTVAEYAAAVDRPGAAQVDDGDPVDPCWPETGEQPASYAQQQVSFLEQLGDGWRAYRCHARFRLVGPLHVRRLENALNGLLMRHEILRTSFIERDGYLQRVVAAELRSPLPLVDLSGAGPADRERALAAHVAHVLDQRFDIGAAPLIRWHLFKLADQEHVLFQSEHHNVHDGLSFRILVRDLAALYSAASAGSAARLPAVEAQYGDFCIEEARWLRSADFRVQLDRWADKLSPFAGNLRLFSDRPRADGQRFIGGQLRQAIPAALLEKINGAAAALGVSRYVFMLAAFAVLCARHGRQHQFLIGSALANRTSARFQSTVGMFVNMVPIPIDAGAADSFASLVRAVSRETDFALMHSAVPLAEIVKRLGLTEVLQGDAPFNVGFSFHDSMKAAPRFHGLEVEIEEALANGSSKFDLSVVGVLGNESSAHPMELLFEYSADLFDRTAIARMAGHYCVLLEAVAADPAARLRDLPLLTPREREQALVAWSGAGAGVVPSECIHQRFEAQAARQPGALAVICGDRRLCYGELNERSNQLAHHLRALGVRPDTLVAICLERGLEMVVGLMGILKAGGAYVPLDPEDPPERLAYMLDDTAAPVVVTAAGLRGRLAGRKARAVCMDSDWAAIAENPVDNPINLTRGQHLVYCIYTSGSTGQPKGVINTHAGFANLVDWYFSDGMGGGERIILASSLSFDLTQKNVIGPLGCGATLIVPPGASIDIDSFRSALEAHRPTRINCAPSAYRAYQECAAAQSLRTVVLGGEPVDAVMAADLSASNITLVNSYGPTECADVALSYVRQPDAAGAAVPLGRPIPNVQVYVLDEALNPVPVDVVGEIHIAGAGVARGYLNRPALTAESFMPNPFGAPGSRMYRTGDLGRYLPDGDIAFLGRIDHQVKIHGFRIELSEIESVLLACAGVREAVVVAREDSPGDRRLAAYVTARAPGAITVEALCAHLRRSLPDYMVPAAWLVLDALPLNRNGKIDRKALPPPASGAAAEQLGATQSQASDTDDRELATVLAILRGLMPGVQLEADDDLFAKGLHSIAMMRFVSQCRSLLAAEVKVRDVYRRATARKIAQAIAAARDAA